MEKYLATRKNFLHTFVVASQVGKFSSSKWQAIWQALDKQLVLRKFLRYFKDFFTVDSVWTHCNTVKIWRYLDDVYYGKQTSKNIVQKLSLP